jgi:Leucine-rich repeat (LRR) protein
VLETFDVSSNQLTGAIPSGIFDLSSIKSIHLDENNLDGTIPENYGDPPLLQSLSLYDNSLTGSVPAVRGSSFQSLQELFLYNNALSGSMPESICNLRLVGLLTELSADCGGNLPKFACACCTSCFDGVSTTRRA